MSELDALQSKSNARSVGDFFAKMYTAFFIIIAGTIISSPIVQRVFDFNSFDRLLEVILVAVACLRGVELLLKRGGLDSVLIALFAIILLYFAIALSLRVLSGDLSLILFLIEGKILLFLSLLILFSGYRFDRGGGRIVIILYCSFIVAGVLWKLLDFDFRIYILNESNYTILSIALLAFIIISYYDLRPFSIGWSLLFFTALPVVIMAESRTGFVVMLVALGSSFWQAGGSRTKRLGYSVVALALVVIAFLMSPLVIPRMTQLLVLENVDRVIFFQEFLRVTSENGMAQLIFGGNVGNLVTYDLNRMEYWSLIQIEKFEHDYGVAPFHFHSAFLRMFSAHGLFITGIILLFVYRALGSLNWIAFIMLLLASLSMSTFYLSSVIPFMLLTVMIQGRVASGRRVALFSEVDFAASEKWPPHIGRKTRFWGAIGERKNVGCPKPR
jgi:hypothetical protein